MGLLQAGYRTYESRRALAGVPVEGEETLTPVSHMVQNVQIEITLGSDGAFQDAKAVPKENGKTIIPVTEESAGRVGVNDRAHPLTDKLQYLAAFGGTKYAAYLSQLTAWDASPHSHPKVQAVLRYIKGGGILADLETAGLLTVAEKCLVRWRVLSAPPGSPAACFEDASLFAAFSDYYDSLRAGMEQDLCMLSGEMDTAAASHPKGVVAANFNAKLISANDSSGFTYRGRFTTADQAGVVGYTASQKAHSGLRWAAANDGVIMGGRTFLWWNPEGKTLPRFDCFGLEPEDGAPEEKATFASYKDKLLKTLGGYRQALSYDDQVMVAALDAATTGRLSVTYYNELGAADFLDRLEEWYATCCWDSRYYGVQSPPIKQIALYAFGVQRGNFVEADDRVLREQVQRLLPCIVDRRPIPADLVRALAGRASLPLAYSPGNRERLLCIACAVIRKYRNDKKNKEEWTLALDENNPDRSYLFGRLLAVAEHVERSAFDAGEGREPNAVRIQSVFSQRPLYAWRILEEALRPYYQRLAPGLRQYYRNLTDGITERLESTNAELNKKLDDVYILGYYHQRAALRKKKETNKTTEETHDESVTE